MRKLNIFFLIPFLLFTNVVLSQQNTSKPNFIFYVADDQDKLDYDIYSLVNLELSINDRHPANTSNVTRLADEGMLFTNCYTPIAICAPSRSSLYTGKYPVRNGAYVQHLDSYDDGGNTYKSITQLLQAQGYDVILAGKSHVKPESNQDDTSNYVPYTYDWSYIFLDQADKNAARLTNTRDNYTHDIIPTVEIKNHIDHVASNGNKPFCMFVTSHYPHPTYPSNGKYTVNDVIKHPYMNNATTRVAEYYEGIDIDNELLGDVLYQLDQHEEIKQNTVFVFSSDHGRAGKYTASEAGLNVPLVVRWPGNVAGGTSSDALISYVDIVPTFLDIAGASNTIPSSVDGHSFKDELLNPDDFHNTYIYGVVTNQNVQNPEIFPARMVRDENFKYIRYTNSQEKLAENLGSDLFLNEFIKIGAANHAGTPYEVLYKLDGPNGRYSTTNLVNKPVYKADLERLSSQLDIWMADQGDFLGDYPAPLLRSSLHALDVPSERNVKLKPGEPLEHLAYTLTNSEVLNHYTNIPMVPKQLVGHGNSDTEFTLSWTPSIYSANVEKYHIIQNGVFLSSVDAAVTSATISDLDVAAEYSYTLKAVSYEGVKSEASNSVAFTGVTQLVSNGHFEEGYDISWNHLQVDEAEVTYSEITTNLIQGSTKALKAVLTKLGKQGYHASSKGAKFEVQLDKQYELSFYAKASSVASIKLVLQSSGQFQFKDFELTDTWTKYTHVFTAAADATDAQVKLWYLNEGETYFIDNVLAVYKYPILGLIENKGLSERIVELYPNPAETFLKVEIEKSGNYMLNIFDVNGRTKISTSIMDATKKSIDVGNLIPGVYYLRIKSDLGEELSNHFFVKK